MPAGEGGHVDLATVLRDLGDRGIGRVLVEGGAAIYKSVLAAGLDDEIVVFRAPCEIGPQGISALPGSGLALFDDQDAYRRLQASPRGRDLMLHYERAAPFQEWSSCLPGSSAT